jgi:cupin 2 domain-containing protein
MLDNLFADLPVAAEDEERFDTLLERPGLKVERIVSTGQCSAPDFWYDQHTAEWVVLLQGQALLRLEGEAEPRTLRVGDFLDIPAHTRHRVEATRNDGPTVWLAIHY